MYPRELHDEAEGRVVHLESETDTSRELATLPARQDAGALEMQRYLAASRPLSPDSV